MVNRGDLDMSHDSSQQRTNDQLQRMGTRKKPIGFGKTNTITTLQSEDME